MKKIILSDLDTQDLVDLFARIGAAQDVALLGAQYAKFRRLFQEMAAVSNELRDRAGDQRRALVVLYQHPNIQVRLKAAKYTLAVLPAEARKQVEDIAGSGWFPQAGDAGMCLALLDDGTFKPT